jgi:hypothetical protein
MLNFGGHLIVGGQFTEIAGIHARGLAEFDGQTWTEFAGGIQGTNSPIVNALVADGANLYVGGRFETIGPDSLPAANIARWTANHWEPLGAGVSEQSLFNPPPTVNSIYISGTNLFAGGTFVRAGSVVANNIARWNGSDWFAMDSGVAFSIDPTEPLLDPPGRVHSLTGDGTNVYVGGIFMRAGGVNATNLAKWNGAAWESIGSTAAGIGAFAWQGEPVSGFINSLVWHDNALYVAGDFTRVSGLAITNFARWKNSTWDAPFAVNGFTVALSKLNDDLYLTGNFDKVIASGISLPATNVFRLHVDAWTPLNSPLPKRQAIYTFGELNQQLFAGGAFAVIDGVAAGNIAKVVTPRWQAITPGRGDSLEGRAMGIATDGTNIFASGDFTSAGSTEVRAVVRWDGSAWREIPQPAPNIFPIVFGTIGSELYATTPAQGIDYNASVVQVWNGQQWRNLSDPPVPLLVAPVIVKSNLFAISLTQDAPGMFRMTATQWDGAAWHSLPWSTTAVNYFVKHATDGTNVFFARNEHVDVRNLVNVTRWDQSEFSSYPPLEGLSAVACVAAYGTNLWVAGFSQAEPRNAKIFLWKNNAWTDFATVTGYFTDMIADQNALTVVGAFPSINRTLANSIAQWDGASWRALDTGLRLRDQPASIHALAKSGRRIVVAGEFDRAGPNTSGNIASWFAAGPITVRLDKSDTTQLQITATPGDRLQIEFTDALDTWSSLGEQPIPTGTSSFTVPTTPFNRFYRAKLLDP